jgi:hypothetical protein
VRGFKIVAAVATFIATVVAILAGLNQLGLIPAFHPDGSGPAPAHQDVAVPAEITLSSATGPRGGSLTVNGSGFQPGELVEIRVHVTVVGTVTADSKGSFTQKVTIPQSAPPPGFPTSVSATGHSSIKTGTAPFSTS